MDKIYIKSTFAEIDSIVKHLQKLKERLELTKEHNPQGKRDTVIRIGRVADLIRLLTEEEHGL